MEERSERRQGQPEPDEPETAEERAKREQLERKLDEALEMSFPASDPISVGLDDR